MLYDFELTLHETPYFPSSWILWKAQKDQVNIIFPLRFWLIKNCISHHQKFEYKTFPVISNTIFPSTILLKTRTAFPISKKLKTRTFTNQWILSFHQLFGSEKDRIPLLWDFQNKNVSVISKNHLSINFWPNKTPCFFISKRFKLKTLQ